MHIPNTRKRAHAAISTSQPPTSGTGPSENKSLSTNRDGRVKTGEEAPLKAAKSFAKFVDYNMSSMTDTRGGFLSTEDDPNNPGQPASGDLKRPFKAAAGFMSSLQGGGVQSDKKSVEAAERAGRGGAKEE